MPPRYVATTAKGCQVPSPPCWRASRLGVAMVERIPATTPDQVFAMDEAEMVEGYQDGRDNAPCGDNRSESYWHGWRNGMVDGGHAKGGEGQRLLARRLIK